MCRVIFRGGIDLGSERPFLYDSSATITMCGYSGRLYSVKMPFVRLMYRVIVRGGIHLGSEWTIPLRFLGYYYTVWLMVDDCTQ